MQTKLEQRVDLLAIVLHKLVNNDSLTEEQAFSLDKLAYLAESHFKTYREEQRAQNKIAQLQLQLDALYHDFPHLKCQNT